MDTQKEIGLIVSGASGSLLALHAIKMLRMMDNVTTHLIITDGGMRTAELELEPQQLDSLKHCADHSHDDRDLATSIASGSNALDGLAVIPCSIRSMSAIAYGQTDRLSIRAADVMLKERKPLVLAVRETPFHAGHLQAMQLITQMGGIIAPPVPAFYLKPQSVNDMAQQSAARLLSLLKLDMGTMISKWEHP